MILFGPKHYCKAGYGIAHLRMQNKLNSITKINVFRKLSIQKLGPILENKLCKNSKLAKEGHHYTQVRPSDNSITKSKHWVFMMMIDCEKAIFGVISIHKIVNTKVFFRIFILVINDLSFAST